MKKRNQKIQSTTLYAILITIILHVIAFLYVNLSTLQTEFPILNEAAILELDFREPEAIEQLLEPLEPMIDESNQSIKDLMQDIQDIRKKSSTNFSESQISKQVENELIERNNQTLNEHKKNEQVGAESEPNTSTTKKTNPTNAEKKAENSYAGKVTRYCNVPGRECYTIAPSYTCKGGGRVQIDIKVDKIGAVKSVKINSANTNTTNECILKQALDYAKRTTKVGSDLKGEHSSSGYIIYNFVSQ